MKFIAACIYHRTKRIRIIMCGMSALKQYIICSDLLIGKEDLWKIKSNDFDVSPRYYQKQDRIQCPGKTDLIFPRTLGLSTIYTLLNLMVLI